MKKIIFSICSIIICSTLLILFLLNSDLVKHSIELAFTIWRENLFPFLFPLFVISEILVSFGFAQILGQLSKRLIQLLFKSKSEASYIFIMSLLTGFPSSAKYINEMYENGILNDKEASKILMFTHFSNPLFIVGTISNTFLNNTRLIPLIIICHYLPNIIIGIIFRNYYPTKKENGKFSISNTLNTISSKSKRKLGSIIGSSIINSINTLLLILGTISIFLVITSILNSIIDLGSLGNSILNGIIEMSQGLKYTSMLNVPLRIKTTLSVMIISFGGLSVHLQIMSILNNTKIKYFPYLLSRIMHTLISGLLSYYLFPLFIN